MDLPHCFVLRVLAKALTHVRITLFILLELFWLRAQRHIQKTKPGFSSKLKRGFKFTKLSSTIMQAPVVLEGNSHYETRPMMLIILIPVFCKISFFFFLFCILQFKISLIYFILGLGEALISWICVPGKTVLRFSLLTDIQS